MITTYGNEYSLMRCDDVKNMKEKSTEDKIEELDKSCSKLGNCSRCILKDDSCSDDEKTDDMNQFLQGITTTTIVMTKVEYLDTEYSYIEGETIEQPIKLNNSRYVS